MSQQDLLQRLEQHGKQFMFQFDDYEDNEESLKEEPKQKSNNTNQKKKKATVEPKSKNITVFREPGVIEETILGSINHKSLDGTEEYVTYADQVFTFLLVK